MAENQLNRITRPNGDLLRVRGDLKYIQGTGTAAVTSSPYCFAKWEAADTNIDSLFDGLMIAYRVPVAGHGTYGTCLSLNGGNYHPVVVQTNTMISTRYGVGAVILLVYSSAVTGSVYGTTAGASATAAANITGCWVAVNNYVDGNTYNQIQNSNGRFYVGSGGVYQYALVALDKDNRFSGFTKTNGTGTSKEINTDIKYRMNPIIFYYGGNNSNTTAGNLVTSTYVTYSAFVNVDTRYSHNYTTTFTQSTPTYIECTIDSDGYWSPTTVCITQTFRSGYFYIYLGQTYSTVYQLTLVPEHPVYYYDGTKLIDYASYKASHATDTKNTAGSTDTSSKIFLVGATTQAANPQTYSDNQVYATNGQLDANQVRVAETVTLQYNSTNKSLDFIFE